MDVLLSVAALATFAFFAARRLLRYLHIFQQDEYDASRFLPWLFREAAFDKRVSAALVLFAAFAYTVKNATLGATETGLIAILFAIAGWMEADPRKVAKKKLALTNRAKRIFGVGLGLSLAAGLVAASISGSVAWLIAVQLMPFLLVVGNWLLKPIEAHIQTSVKHILGHVLQMNTNVLFTPGSVNTVMGISRIINERLADNCRYFLVEMGAYGIGSIARLCKFTPPDHGIITSIGEAHYERFKDLETVAVAKFELAQAVADNGGIMVIDETVLERAHARAVVDGHREGFIVVGDSDAADIQILSIDQTADGLTVRIRQDKTEHTLFAPLYGLHHGRNMALAYALAFSLGFPADRIVAALRSTPQIVHRLEVKRHSTGATYIDDAYNANPAGIAGGLELLQTLRKDGGRRVFVTPGVVELGARHDEIHRELGVKAARATDVTIAVRPDRIATFIEGFKSAATDSELLTFEQFSEAQAWINANLKSGDTILIANDLPDLLERDFVT
jgi:UDP-N-acetylmuramoyl-tripeptide--D-alanyl-D-alanine ligase